MQLLLHIIWRDKKTVLLTLLAGTISGLTAVALFAQSGLLISKAALMPPFYVILILTAFLKLFGVTKSASKYAERLLSHRVTFQLMHDVRMRFFDKLLPQAHVLQRYKSGDLLTRITSDVETLQHFFLRVLYPPLVTMLVFVATMMFMLFFSPLLAGLLLIGLLLTTVIMPAMLSMRKLQAEPRDATIAATEYFYGYRELLLHNAHQQKEQQLRQLTNDYAKALQRKKNRESSSYIWNQAIALTTAFFIIFVGAYAVSTGDVEGVYFAMLILVSLTVFETAIPMASVPTFLRDTKRAVAQLHDITETDENNGSIITAHACAPLLLQDVSYTYERSTRPALSHIHMHIAHQQKIAIVGASGSGKTTLMQLLMHEMAPTSGEVLIGDIPLHQLERNSYYTHIGMMLQHNHFFAGTIRSNLLLANERATDAQLTDALQRAQLDKTLDAPVFEKGRNLSGGEQQRLAFARLLLKGGDIWLVDEPFTSVDVQTEEQLLTTMLCEAADKTLVIITHRLTNLAQFDDIYVMDGGQIVEHGTHEQLLAKNALYARMHEAS